MGITSPRDTVVQDVRPTKPLREVLGQLKGRKGCAGRQDDVHIVGGQSRTGVLGRSDPTNAIVNVQSPRDFAADPSDKLAKSLIPAPFETLTRDNATNSRPRCVGFLRVLPEGQCLEGCPHTAR